MKFEKLSVGDIVSNLAYEFDISFLLGKEIEMLLIAEREAFDLLYKEYEDVVNYNSKIEDNLVKACKQINELQDEIRQYKSQQESYISIRFENEEEPININHPFSDKI